METIRLTQHGKMSWRDFYKVHPACAEWPELPADERKALKADIEANFIKVPIQTRHVAGKDGGVTYVVDGRTRLDLMEELGRRIVNAKGEWIGALIGKVEHMAGRTHREVGLEVISYNGKRRHMTKERLAECIVGTLKVAREMAGKHEGKNDSANLARSFSPTPGKRGGSTKNEFKAKVIKQAAQAGISERTVERVLSKGQPKKKPRPKPVRTFEQQVQKRFVRFMEHWPVSRYDEVKNIICSCKGRKWTNHEIKSER